jgi:hypothetical protein
LCVGLQRNDLDAVSASLQRQVYVFGCQNVLFDLCFQLR